LLFFENSRCLRCGAEVGFAAERGAMVLLDDGGRYQRCAAAGLAECNWVVPAADGGLCRSCDLTRTRPDDGDAEALSAFAEAEAAKRRLVFQLLDLGLPLERLAVEGGPGVAFDLLSSENANVVTGHANGLITVDLAEADDVHRTQLQHDLGEPYRTVLGHFRHEIGHYYWTVLVTGAVLERARALFGDERLDYGEALDRHYQDGPPAGWHDRYVSSYATMHPWEDWAETFAHYLHIRDLVETADSFGLGLAPDAPSADAAGVPFDELELAADEVDEMRFEEVVARWLPLTYALNALNRSIGRDDLYPFVLAPAVIDKLAFVHELVRNAPGRHPMPALKAAV
jgi:hypothetical protein